MKPCNNNTMHCPRGRGTQQSSIQGGSAPRSNPFNPLKYHKIPKISPGAYIFQRPFFKGLILEGPILGKAYVRREICVIKSAGLACSGNEIYHFCFVLLCTQGQILSTSPPGLYSEGLIFGILRYHFDRKGTQLFRLPSFDKIRYPFHIPCLELCMIPF